MAAEQKPQQREEQEHQYLQFVQLATIQALMQCAILYSYVKERAGPLKFGVDTVEEAVKTVVAPIYERFHLVPVELLKYADRKVAELDRRVPSNVKSVSFQACSVVSEIRLDGVSAFAKTAAEQCAVSAWRKLNQLPLIALVVNALLHKKYRYSACADN